MQTSTAATIPEELFEHILWFAPNPIDHQPGSRLLQEQRRYLSSWGSVCRYWARLCRPKLFYKIELRTASDAKYFRDIVHAPTPPGLQPIATLTRMLTVNASNDEDEPWLYMVLPLVLKLDLPRLNFVELRRSGGEWPWRTLHPSLPRSIPGALMPILHLRFDRIRFRSRRALARLLSSMPLLEYLEVLTPTYDVEEDIDASPFRDFRYRMHSASSHDLQLCLSLIPSSISGPTPHPKHGVRNGRQPRGILNQADLSTVKDIFGIFSAAQKFRLGIYRESSKEVGAS